MKNKLLLFIACCAMTVSCSSDYDDSSLWDKVNDLDNRVSYLERLCQEMNTNISSLQSIVNALETGDFITSVTPIMRDGQEVGYTITFRQSPSITIYHGENGADGQDGSDGKDGTDGNDGRDGADGTNGVTPIIGVGLHTDGNYYWTIKKPGYLPEWILDINGKMIRANGLDGNDGADGKDGTDGKDGDNGADGKDGENGKDGTDGITPKLKIENDYWYVSTDNGATWTNLGKAKGDKGDNGNSGFQDIIDGENSVTFVLVGGETIVIPKMASTSITLTFNNIQTLTAGEAKFIPYELTGGDANIVIVGAPQDWSTVVDKENSMFVITSPSTLTIGTKVEIAILVSESAKPASLYPMTLTIVQDADGVLIAGTVWAKRNVGRSKGTFAASPGMGINYDETYYTQNSNVGRSGSQRPNDVSVFVEWSEANDPCPEGWRIPVAQEFDELIASGWRMVNSSANNWNIEGIWFGPDAKTATSSNTGTSIFLSAARWIDAYASVIQVKPELRYWANTLSAYNVMQTLMAKSALGNDIAWSDPFVLTVTNRGASNPGYPIRCVRK